MTPPGQMLSPLVHPGVRMSRPFVSSQNAAAIGSGGVAVGVGDTGRETLGLALELRCWATGEHAASPPPATSVVAIQNPLRRFMNNLVLPGRTGARPARHATRPPHPRIRCSITIRACTLAAAASSDTRRRESAAGTELVVRARDGVV